VAARRDIDLTIIEHSILIIRGQRVMLDRDLAALYGVETRVLNQAVRRNIRRFPDDFMLSLSRDEIRDISQIVISSNIKHARSVFAFTEQGVAMLSSVLNSERAIQVNILVMRTFVRLRQMLAGNAELASKLAQLESRYDKKFAVVFEAIRQLMAPPVPPRKKIGFHVKEPRAAYRVNRSRR